MTDILNKLDKLYESLPNDDAKSSVEIGTMTDIEQMVYEMEDNLKDMAKGLKLFSSMTNAQYRRVVSEVKKFKDLIEKDL